MKIYVTARFKKDENKSEIEALCSAVRKAGHEDFCFIRDIEGYQKVFSNLQDLWQRSRQEIEQCDALLIDVSDKPSGGRVIEAGIAYGLHQPIFVIVKNNIDYKDIYKGIASKIIHYDSYDDIIPELNSL